MKSRVARLPENLCFDEFRSVNSTMSFICCDAEVSHDIVAILENRLTKTIREHFMNRCTNRERAAVKSVVVDLNAQYIKFIKSSFAAVSSAFYKKNRIHEICRWRVTTFLISI